MNFGLVRQERDKKKINKHDLFYELKKKCSLFSMRFINDLIEMIQVLKI